MAYLYTAISDAETPRAAEPQWQHVVDTYVSECNKTASMWRAVPGDCLDFRPHEKVNTIRTIFAHQLLSERRFFAEFVGTEEPPADQLLPSGGDAPTASAYTDQYIKFAKHRLPQLAAGTTDWWLTERPFFDGLTRQRIWIFWRRVLHTCHHRTQVQTWLRLAGQHVPTIYGPSGDETWSGASPTYSINTAQDAATSPNNLPLSTPDT
jgi:uncharacterized damage-inducible protein DinB